MFFCQKTANLVWQQIKHILRLAQESQICKHIVSKTMYFSIQNCLSEGSSVDHFVKWSRRTVWHRELFFLQKTNFPTQKKNIPRFQIWDFFIKSIGLWQVSIFMERYLSKTLSDKFYKNQNFKQKQCLHYVRSLDINSFNIASVGSCVEGAFIKFIA